MEFWCLFPGPIMLTDRMTEQKNTEVKYVNSAIKENKEVEKMVKQVISNGKPVSQEGSQVLKCYFSSVVGLNSLLGEK